MPAINRATDVGLRQRFKWLHGLSVVQRADVPAELAALKDVWLVGAADRLSDGAVVGELDEAFHGQLVAAAGNAEMHRVHDDVTERVRVVRRLDFTRGDRIEATYVDTPRSCAPCCCARATLPCCC